MNYENKVSAVITTYRDRGHLWDIIDAWASFNVPVYLADGRLDSELIRGISHHRYWPDPGNKIRFATAQLTTTPYVILADDDFIPKPGLIEDFFKWNKYGFMGIIGKEGNDADYRKATFHRADRIDKPVRTAFIGVCYFVHRRFLQFDYAELTNRAVDDLYWQLYKFNTIPKHVIPTKNYENLPECNDKDSIFKTPESRKYREDYWREWCKRNDPIEILKKKVK